MNSKDETTVYIGRSKITIIGLKSIFNELKKKKTTDEKKLKNAILQEVKKNNYVPESAEQEYQESLYEEFKVYTGQQKERNLPNLIEIKILGQGCYSCNKMEEYVKEILCENGIPADVEHIKDINEIARYGLIPTPALIINHKAKASGRLPAKEDIERWIKEAAVKQC